MSPIRIAGIAEITCRRLKEPALVILLLFGIIFGYTISEMETFSFQEDLLMSQVKLTNLEKPILGSFLMIAFLTILIGIFTGASEIPKDIETRMVLILLGKPITRNEYLVGKFIGVLTICIIFFGLSGLSVIVGHLIKTGHLHDFRLILRQFSLISIVLPFLAMSVFISCFLAEISAMIVTVIYVFCCFAFCIIPILIAILPKSISFKSPILAIYYFFPNFYLFLIPFKFTGIVQIFILLYAIAVSGIFLSLSSLRINNRDLI